LLSLSALLAAHELKEEGFDVSVAHIECDGYKIENEEELDGAVSYTALYGLWLTGEMYAA
jgi:hypothetical protein